MIKKYGSLAAYVDGVPSFAEIAEGITPKQMKFTDAVKPHIVAELRDSEKSRQMATSINGADAYYRNSKFDKAFFAELVAKRYEEATGDEVDPALYPTIARVTGNILSGSGNSPAQRRATARRRRDGEQE